MTPPSNPFQSTVFRLAAIAVVALTLAAAAVVFFVGTTANAILTETTEAAIEADAAQLRGDYANGGIDALIAAVTERGRHAAGAVYFLADAAGVQRAGNLTEPPRVFRGGGRAGTFQYRVKQSGVIEQRLAAGLVIDIDNGRGRLIVGRDISNQHSLLFAINRSLGFGLGAIALLGLGGGYLIARRLLQRIDGMSHVARDIMAGKLDGRLPLSGSGDELDRLASQLNAMLERIERLMSGLREVSDNIAHDLKTPLNRLRNRAETALSDPRGSAAWRDGLECTIEEADNLISTFNALLLIARLEAGSIQESLENLDLAEIAGDVAELYAPLAEDRGMHLELDLHPPVAIRANRQLIGQAIANLIDNAIKYGARSHACAAGIEDNPSPSLAIIVAARSTRDHAILTVADHGPGIPAADRERALKRFVRLDASRTRPGTGLGLSLVAAVAQMHNGSIRLDDNRPGLSVVLELPIADAIALAPRTMPSSTPPDFITDAKV